MSVRQNRAYANKSRRMYVRNVRQLSNPEGHNILPTIASFFMASAVKFEGVPDFKIKFFE